MTISIRTLFYWSGRLFFYSALLVILSIAYVQAGSPRIGKLSKDSIGREIKIEYDSNMSVFAEARLRSGSNINDKNPQYFVALNPELYYLGRYTQIWLYLRQCVHIRQNHDIIRHANRELNIHEEQIADCLAIEEMKLDRDYHLSIRQIDAIERDIERIIKNNQWRDVFAGPERRIYLRHCDTFLKESGLR